MIPKPPLGLAVRTWEGLNAYIDHRILMIDAQTDWDDDIETKRRVWDLYKNTPPPLGYDPAMFFQSVDNPETGALRLKPWRIELFSLTDLASGTGPKVWRA